MKKKYGLSLLAITFLCLQFSACSLFTAAKVTSDDLYMIERMPSSSVCVKRGSRTKTLLVTQVDSVPLFDTTRIVYSKKPFEVAYFAKSRWAETPGQMLTPLLVQTLQNTKRFRQVGQTPYIGRADYILTTHILKFQQNYCFQPPTFQLYAKVQLLNVSNMNSVVTDVIKIEQPLPCEGPYGGAIAANLATEKLLSQIASLICRKTI